MDSVGIGIVGSGWIANIHAHGYAHAAGLGARVVAVAGRDRVKAETFAAQHKVERVHDDALAVIADPNVDVVDLAVPNVLHHELALKALAAGKHVFCEKPLGLGVAESRVMLDAAQRSGLVHMTGFNYIRTPASQLFC